MLDLYDELTALIGALSEHEVDYALCGGLAMAVYGLPRATVDIDLLVSANDLSRAKTVGIGLGFDMEAQPMRFAGGAVEMCRLSKVDPGSGDLLSLDLVMVTPALHEAWTARTKVLWEAGELWVVSRDGLIAMKRLRGSGQDADDIKHLEETRGDD